MKNSNTQFVKGFLFVEVVIATAVVGILLTAILTLQSAVFKRVVSNAKKIEHLLPLQRAWYAVRMNPLEKEQKKTDLVIKDPEMSIAYEKISLEDNAQLNRFKGLTYEMLTGTWQGWGDKREVLGIMLFEPDKEKKKEQ